MNAPAVSNASPRQLAFAWIMLAAAGTFAATMGTRQSMALFISPLNSHTGLGLSNISLAFAFGQLWWGLTQPFAGVVADRIGAGRVILLGIGLVALGMALTPYMSSTAGLILTVGMLGAGGAGMAGPAVLMAATNRMVDPARRGMATGIVNAGGSVGQFLLAPVAALLIALAGWASAMQIMALLVLLALPAAWVLKGSGAAAVSSGAATAPRLTLRQALQQAWAYPSFRLLCAGFFVCGFHVAFLATHLPGIVAACGLSTQWAGWALAMLGGFNVLGSLAMGWAVGRWRMKSLLSLVYAARALAVVLFLLAPKTGTVLLIFSAVMGLTFLSTVPPTAGLVAKFFGPANMATLFGIVMLSHQVGGFLGAWLGGVLYERTGSYDTVWFIDIALAVAAALIHLPIREAAAPPWKAAPQAA